MSEELVKKLYHHNVSMDDLMKVRESMRPLYRGLRINDSLSFPFFISHLGTYKDKSVGIIITDRDVASYKGKFSDKVSFDMKYLGLHKLSPTLLIRANGVMTLENSSTVNGDSKIIQGYMTLKDNKWGLILQDNFSERVFYDMVNKHFNIF